MLAIQSTFVDFTQYKRNYYYYMKKICFPLKMSHQWIVDVRAVVPVFFIFQLKHDATERDAAKKKLKSDVQHAKTSDAYRGWEAEPETYRHREERSKDRGKIKSSKGRGESDREEKVVKKEEVVRKVVAVISSDSDEGDDDSDTEEDYPSPSKNNLKLDTEEFGLNMDDIVCAVCK